MITCLEEHLQAPQQITCLVHAVLRTGCYRFCSYVLFSQSSSCVWESPLPYLHFLPTTRGSTTVSAKHTMGKKILNSVQSETDEGGVVLEWSEQCKTWNQYFSWQRTLEAALHACRLIGHGVNCLSIHHEHLLIAGSKTLPEICCSGG